MLVGDGEVPAPLRAGDAGVDVGHRDARLALGVDRAGLDYFRSRVTQGRRDSEQAIAFVTAQARTAELQDRCVAALVRKTEILWHLLDSVQSAGADPGAA